MKYSDPRRKLDYDVRLTDKRSNQKEYRLEQLGDGRFEIVDEMGTKIDGPFRTKADAVIVLKELLNEAAEENIVKRFAELRVATSGDPLKALEILKESDAPQMEIFMFKFAEMFRNDEELTNMKAGEIFSHLYQAAKLFKQRTND